MNTIKKLSLIFLSASTLILMACSDKKPASVSATTDTSSTTSNTTQGNWQAKASELASANTTDIKADLASINTVINSSNTNALELRNAAQQVKTDPEKLKEIMKKVRRFNLMYKNRLWL